MRPAVPRLLVIGDVMLDVTGRAASSPTEACRAGHLPTPLAPRLGGTGLVAALEAARPGTVSVGLWGAIGCDRTGRADPAGAAALAALADHGVHDLLRREPSAPTGTAVCVWFDGNERMLLAEPGANRLVDADGPAPDVLAFARSSQLVYVSGYALTAEARAAQVIRLTEVARANGALAVVDVVPHRFAEAVPGAVGRLDQFDVLVGEVATLHRLYGVGPLPTTRPEVEKFAARLLPERRMVILRPNDHHELVACRDHPPRWLDTGYARLPDDSRAGSLDRRTIRLLLGLTDLPVCGPPNADHPVPG